jgi:NAD(P)-dependent dehydrogenase (short-subunit alcohol dehydrogenase family)
MATVLVIGASKGIGLATVQAALKAGHSVRALARTATAIHIDHPKLEKADGDARDQDTIERALANVEAVIQTLGVTPAPSLIVSGTPAPVGGATHGQRVFQEGRREACRRFPNIRAPGARRAQGVQLLLSDMWHDAWMAWRCASRCVRRCGRLFHRQDPSRAECIGVGRSHASKLPEGMQHLPRGRTS